MMKSKTLLLEAGAALDAIATEIDLMDWHDAWMTTDEYTAMSDNDAKLLEALFQERCLVFSDQRRLS